MDELFNPLIEHAIELSAEWHDQTYRKKRWRAAIFEVPEDTVLRVPFFAHLAAVALTVQRAGWGDEVVAAAFLHDVLEDENRFGHSLRVETLREALGEQVLSYVLALTEQKYDEGERPRRWKVRKEAYVKQIREAPPEVSAISLADKLHNLWTINQALASGVPVFATDEQGKALSAGPEEQLWFFEAVVAATARHEDPRLEPMRERLNLETSRLRARLTGT